MGLCLVRRMWLINFQTAFQRDGLELARGFCTPEPPPSSSCVLRLTVLCSEQQARGDSVALWPQSSWRVVVTAFSSNASALALLRPPCCGCCGLGGSWGHLDPLSSKCVLHIMDLLFCCLSLFSCLQENLERLRLSNLLYIVSGATFSHFLSFKFAVLLP